MLFKDLKAGYPIYLFDRNSVEVSTGKVINVSVPHLDCKMGGPTEMVVDVTVEENGQNKTYTFKDGTDVGYANSLIISVEREHILREVEAMKNQSEQALAQVEKHKTSLEKCTTILAEFNPAFKEKKETEERFSKMEGSIEELKDMVKGLFKELKG